MDTMKDDSARKGVNIEMACEWDMWMVEIATPTSDKMG